MATTKKALALAVKLADELRLRAPMLAGALAITEGFDVTTGNPTIVVGAGGIGDAGGFIMISPVAFPNSYNVIGQVASVYTPHVVQIVTEANPAGGAGADINTPAQLLGLLLAPALKLGCKVEWYNAANGSAADAADITEAKLVASYDDLQFPLLGGQ
jgi:hypothetical protein